MAPERDSRSILTEPPPPPADLRVAYGVETMQFADLRVPARAGPSPLAVVVHGGGWQANFNLIHAGHLCEALRRRGIATWNVEYRRIGDPGAGWPASYDDVRAALRRALDGPELSSAAVVVIGHSAGGQLGLLAGSAAGVPVVAIAAAADFDMWETDGARAFLGNADRADTSPRRRLPLGIRQVVVHGMDDAVTPFEVSQQYVEAARAAGDDAELVGLPSAGHFDAIDPRSSSWPRVERAICDVLGL